MRENLRKARKDAGMTAGEVAEKIFISKIQYYRIEEGSTQGSGMHWRIYSVFRNES